MTTPLGKSFSYLTKYYIGTITQMLSGLEIERYFYPIALLHDSPGPMCQNDLAEAIGADKVTMVRIVNYLSDQDYLKRERSHKDRRYYHLELTAKGKKAAPEIKAAFEAANKICFNGFKKSEQKTFEQLLNRVDTNLRDHPREEVKLNYKKIK